MNLPCAIYTRKSSEEGLEQGFNSLDAQREACAAYILSQKTQGWKPLPAVYDDGGFSGGNVQRPALQRLLVDVAAGKIKIVVVYKVDRLTRSLADFAKLVELFDAHGVSFVSVTQQFNTTTSMGRLTLNVLLSFAQFEREVTGERIRDKIAASKVKGMWMGGIPPVGYVPDERTLAIDEPQAGRIRQIYRMYLELGSVKQLQSELAARGWVTPARISRRTNAAGGRPFSRGHLYRILSNPIYVGRVPHRGQSYLGRHTAIIDQVLWDQVQAALEANRQGERTRPNVKESSLLCGLLFDAAGNRFTADHAKKGPMRYRYYVVGTEPPVRLPAREIEQLVIQGLYAFLGDEAQLLGSLGDAPPKAIAQMLARTREWASKDLAHGALHDIIDRVRISDVGITITVRKHVLGDDPISFSMAVQLKRCGMAMRLIVPPQGKSSSRPADPKLMGVIAKAQGWFKRLATGEARSFQEIADQEQLAASYISRVIALAFLAPDIVEKIGRGDQPSELNATKLLRLAPLPIEWEEQRRLLRMPH